MIVTTWRSKEGFWLWVPTEGLLWDKPQINFESVTPLQWSPSWWWSTPLQRSDLSSWSWSLYRTVIILFIFHHHGGQFHLSERVGNAAYRGLNPWLNGTVTLYQNCPRSASFMFHLMKMMKIMMVILFSTAVIGIWWRRSFFDPLPQFPCIFHVVRQSHAEKNG